MSVKFNINNHELPERLRKLVPVKLEVNLSHVSQKDRSALIKLTEASKILDHIFLRQSFHRNAEFYEKLKSDSSDEGKQKFQFFWTMMGCFDKLEDNKPFIEGVEKKPSGANYYPLDMSKEEFENWVKTLSEDEQQKAKGFFYVIRRNKEGKLISVPYNTEYKEFLEPAAKLLHEASELVENKSMKTFLKKRADAFLSNDYYESDCAWMDVDDESPLEVTIGPYEVYEDNLFGYKASFEAFICVRNFEETKKLKKFGLELQNIENNLPIESKYKNPKLGESTPIVVVDEIMVGGDKGGVQTAAYNLPNDERVVEEKGSKKVMLRNVQQAKFGQIMVPLSNILISESQRKFISFDAFFTHILCHEVLHGLGPHNIKLGTSESTVRKELQELHSSIEEAKADITGLWALQYLMDKGVVEKSLEPYLYVTFLAGAFRSIRFGLEEAHGKGQAVQLNFLIDEGGFVYNQSDKTFSVNFEKIKPAVTKLVNVILTLQAEGNKGKGKELLDAYGINRNYTKEALDRINYLPIDIATIFPELK